MATFPEYSHRYRSTRAYPTYGKLCQIRVDASLHYLNGNARPYFAVGAEIGTARQIASGNVQACGCLHEDTLKLWPELAPVVALHLCDDTGIPMHAEANGWYQLAGYYQTDDRYHAGNSRRNFPLPEDKRDPAKPWLTSENRYPTPDECLQFFADHVRLPLNVVRELADGWRCADDWKSSRRWFARWLDSQTARFQADADAAIVLLDSLIERQGKAKATPMTVESLAPIDPRD